MARTIHVQDAGQTYVRFMFRGPIDDFNDAEALDGLRGSGQSEECRILRKELMNPGKAFRDGSLALVTSISEKAVVVAYGSCHVAVAALRSKNLHYRLNFFAQARRT